MFKGKRTLLFTAAILAAIVGAAATGKACGPRHDGPGERHSMLFEEITEDLELTEVQQKHLTTLREEERALRSEGAEERSAVHDAIRAELESEEPDLRKIVELTRSKLEEKSTLRQEMIDAQLGFYETLTPVQKKQVAENMLAHLERMDAKRKRVRGRSEGHFGYRGF